MLRRGRLGFLLLVIGLVTFVLGPRLGLSELGRPWTFVVSFSLGVITGVGTVFTLYDLSSHGHQADGRRS